MKSILNLISPKHLAIFALSTTDFAYRDFVEFLDQLVTDKHIKRWRRVEGGRAWPPEIAVEFESDGDAILAKLHWP